MCYYKDKGLNFISDMDGEPLKMIVEVIYTLILKQKGNIRKGLVKDRQKIQNHKRMHTF